MPDVPSLADLLQWNANTLDLLGEIDAIRIDFVAKRFGVTLADAGAEGILRERLDRLPDLSLAAAERLLRSPVLCQAIRTNNPSLAARTAEAEIVLEILPEERIDRWNALGQVWLGEMPPSGIASPMSRDAFGRAVGPSVNGRIPIDLSLAAIPDFPKASLDCAQRVDSRVSPEALRKLDEAWQTLSAISDTASEVVKRMTSNLVLRNDDSAPPRLRSATSAAALGRSVLVNVDHPEVQLADIVEGLVHEAIHTTISSAELAEPLITAAADSGGAIRSPWSGAELHPHAFLHACLVWFGLLQLWLAAEDRGCLAGRSRRRVDDIRTGFRDLDLSAIRDRAPVIPSTTYALIADVQQRACQ